MQKVFFEFKQEFSLVQTPREQTKHRFTNFLLTTLLTRGARNAPRAAKSPLLGDIPESQLTTQMAKFH